MGPQRSAFFSTNFLKFLIAGKLAILVAFLLFESGVVYFGEKTLSAEGNAKAQGLSESKSKEKAEESSSGDSGKTYLERLLDMPNVDGENLKKSEVAKYLDIIQRKKTQVEQRIKILATREKGLKDLQGTIEEKINNLEEERRFFAESVQKEKKLKEDRLNELTAFYEKMGPKKAAPVFEKMDKDLVVALFKKMPVKKTMGILEIMSAERSVELTEYYGRIKSGKEYDLLKEVNQSLVSAFDEKCKEKGLLSH